MTLAIWLCWHTPTLLKHTTTHTIHTHIQTSTCTYTHTRATLSLPVAGYSPDSLPPFFHESQLEALNSSQGEEGPGIKNDVIQSMSLNVHLHLQGRALANLTLISLESGN